jgi:hypothetical protein
MDINRASPRPFGEIFGLWLKVFKMDDAFFAAEAPRVSNGNVLLALLIYAVVVSMLAVIPHQAGYSQILLQHYFGNTPATQTQFPVCILLVELVLLLLSFYISITLYHLSAKLLGAGSAGSFSTLAYLVSLFYFPLGIVVAVVNLIPSLFLGALLVLAVGIYRIVLTVRAIRFNYQLSTGRAVEAYFLPVVVIFGLVLIGIVILALLAPSLGSIFSNVIRGLGTPVP